MIRKAVFLLSGNGLDSLILFARNLLVARLLSIEDYGVATTFALTAMLIEMASQMGLKQLIVQAPEGEDPRFQAGLQGFQLLRGVMAGIALIALAGPLARFLHVPEIAWAYRVLALVPVLQGFLHFDLHRLERHSEFRPLIYAFTGASLLSLLAVWPLHVLLGDWRIMLAAIVLQHGVQIALSHALARRRYAATLDRVLMRRALVFGWPLLFNGLLLFAVFHGEKLIAGHELGLAALGILGMGVTLTLTPSLIMAKSVQSLMLPRLARAKGKRFTALGRTSCDAGAAAGMGVIAGTAIIGPPFVQFVLGAKFAPLLPLLVPLAAVQAVRMLKTGPSLVALSRARTTLPMYAQLPRLASIGVVWMVLAGGGTLLDLALVALLGELAGLVLAYVLMARSPEAPQRWLSRRGAIPLTLIGLLLAADLSGSFGIASPRTCMLTTWSVIALMGAWVALAGRGAIRLLTAPQTTA